MEEKEIIGYVLMYETSQGYKAALTVYKSLEEAKRDLEEWKEVYSFICELTRVN